MTTDRDPAALCTATKASTGARCTAYALAGQPTCYMHSPGAQHGRRKASSAPAVPLDITQPLPMKTHEQIRAAMELVVNAIRDGSLPTRSGLAMVQAARLALTAVNEDRDARIAELERAVAAQHPTTHQRKRR